MPTREVLDAIAGAILPKQTEGICAWTERTVNLSYDHTASAIGLVHLYPYQREPLASTEAVNCHEVTLCWSPRLGKSSVWKYALLKRIHDGGCAGLIVYPSLAMAERTNRDTVLPLLESLPEARKDLALRSNRKKDSYHIPSLRSTCYYQGGGSQVVSLTCNFTVADEVDQIELPKAGDTEDGKNIDQLKAIRLRMQTFRRRMMVVCSSPTISRGAVWQSWLKGSRGKWHLRCLGCGGLFPCDQLAFKTHDGAYAGLQWDKDADGNIAESSLRWICPSCGKVHLQEDAEAMNEGGEYIHQRPSCTLHRSYQCGAMGNPWLWTWLEIAQAQEQIGEEDGRKHLQNNILGVPFTPRERSVGGEEIKTALESHKAEYPADLHDKLALVVLGIDQQKSELAGEKYWCWIARGWDEAGNSYLLGAGTDNTITALEAHIKQEWCGHRASVAMIDHGGFDNTDTDSLLNSCSSLMYYKGENDRVLKGGWWTPSASNKRMFIASALRYQVKLLSLLYDPPRPAGYKFYIPLEPQAEYLTQLGNVRANARMSKDGNGDAYANWCATGGNRRDFFDCEKMALVGLDIACHYISPHGFAHGNKPLFIRREWLVQAMRQKALRK